MLLHTKRYLALAAAVMMTAALGSGCAKKSDERSAHAKITVDASALQSDVQSIQLTITGEPDSPGAPGFPITAFLTKPSPSSNVWVGNVSSIPAAATPGLRRTFTASAYSGPNATGTKLYEGTTIAFVITGQTAQVTIILQELNPGSSDTNYAPVITSVTSTAAYLLPGQGGTFSVSGYDPDDSTHLNRPQFNGEPLAYLWSASCDSGTLALSSPTASTTAFTAPNVTTALCTISVRVSETALTNNSSVTTYFTVAVNGNFGNADLFAFPNTGPIVTVRGDFRYNFSSDVITIPVGQQGDLFFHATDPDGDNVRYDLSAICSDAGFDGAGQLSTGAVPVDAVNFSAITLTTASGTSFDPTFGYPSPVMNYADPHASCQFKILVHDLCTAGNCGPAGSQGSKPDGADRGGATTGYLNASAPAQPRRAPSIVRVTVPNQNGGTVPGVNSWDPQRYVVVLPSTTYNLSVEGYDNYEAGPLTITQVCNVGVGTPGAFTTPSGIKSGKLDATWTAPSGLVADMSCSFTVTSVASGLATVAQVHFAGTDPCIGQADGTVCDDGNACTTGTTCLSGVCAGGTTTTCSALDACHVAGVCDPNTGVCSNPTAANGTSCNADSSGCTAGDSCQAGVCQAGSAVACNSPPNGYCFPASGACQSTGNSTFTCQYTANVGGTCSVANAGAKCNGSAQFTSFACDASGACVGSGSQACANTVCANGNVCQAASGACAGGSNSPSTTPCDDADACTTADHCNGAGTCIGGGALCPAGQTCSAGSCLVPRPVPVRVNTVRYVPPGGLSMDTSGNTYLAGYFGSLAAVNFQTESGGPAINLTTQGGSDALIAKYSASGAIQWITQIGDNTASNATDQTLTLSAVSQNGKVVAVGKFAGGVTMGTDTVSAANPTPVVAGFNSDGTKAWVKMYDLGANGLFQAVAANPNQSSNRFAACGYADGAATSLDPSAVYGGAQDAIIGAWDSNGAKLWAKQIGTTALNENCAAVAVDNSGNVIAVGQFDGATIDLGGGFVLTGPNSTAQKYLWIARFDGATGATLAAAAFNGTLGNAVPRALSVSAAGDIAVGGSFTGNLTIGAAMTTAGSEDAFVALLHSDFSVAWNAVRIGGTALDLVRSVAFTSFGDIVALGNFNPSSAAFRTANGGNDTNGAAGLLSAGSADAMVLKINGLTGATDDAKSYGNAATQSGDTIAVNRFGANQISFTNTSGGTVTYAPGVVYTAVDANNVALVLANLQ